MKRIFVILLSAIMLSSCTLEEKVVSSSMPENYYQTVPQIITGLNGCYIPLKSIYGSYQYFAHTEVATDLYYYTRYDKKDGTSNFSPVDPQFGDNLWNNCYIGVMRCNAIYAAIERAPLNDIKATQMVNYAALPFKYENSDTSRRIIAQRNLSSQAERNRSLKQLVKAQR